jgi:aryl-phospho-beta-D-glucosidase BglC (GH1 family)
MMWNVLKLLRPAKTRRLQPVRRTRLAIEALEDRLAPAAMIDFSGGFAGSPSTLMLNSAANVNGSKLELTNGADWEDASVFASSPVDVTGFNTQFTFQLSAGSNTADGFTFTLQGAGPTALGALGGGLGYGTDGVNGGNIISKSVAIKFDLYDNQGEGSNSTGLYTNGANPTNSGSIDLTPAGLNLHSGDIFQVNMTYSGTSLTVTIKDTRTNTAFTHNYGINIPATVGSSAAYVGFTAGTGGLAAVQDILTWTFAPAASPTPAQLSISSATGTEGSLTAGGGGGGADYFHTSGNQIVDAFGNDVKIAGVNWFGLEGGSFAPEGLNVRSYQSMMDQMKQLGYNSIRIPFSNQIFDAGNKPTSINYALNPDLTGLNPLGVLDKIVAYAGQDGLRIILDDHNTTTAGPNASGLWYNSAYPQSTWINDWVALAKRYANNPTVIGADLFNEPHGNATWGDGNGGTDWRLAAQNAGNAILAANPSWLIFVEGIQVTAAGFDWWGGNLGVAGQYPVVLSTPDHVVYSPHDYTPDVAWQTWFSDPSYPNNLPAVWTKFWGYLFINNIAPLYLGEFGTTLATTADQQWMSKLTNYLQGNMNSNGSSMLKPGQQGISWAYWAWNPTSSDVGGLLQNDWKTPVAAKAAALQQMQFAFPSGGTAQSSPGTPLTFTVTLSAASATPVTVAYTTVDGTAKSGLDYTLAAGLLIFPAGVTSETITVQVLSDAALTTSRTFSVVLSAPAGATIAQGTGLGTIQPAAPAAGGSPVGAPNATVTTAVTADWGNAFNENVTITNTGTQPFTNWTLEFDLPLGIMTLWSGTIVVHTGNHYVVVPVWYNQTIAPGQSITLGFTASGSSQVQPTNFKLNGQAV